MGIGMGRECGDGGDDVVATGERRTIFSTTYLFKIVSKLIISILEYDH